MAALTQDHIDAIKEIVNIGVGRAAASLSEMLNAPIELRVPDIHVLDPGNPKECETILGTSALSCVKLAFQGSISGHSMLVFPPESAARLVSVLVGEEQGSAEMNAVMAGTLNEVGNIVMNSVMGSISNIIKKHLAFSLPQYVEGTLGDLLSFGTKTRSLTVLLVTTNFFISDRRITGSIFIIFEVESFDNLLNALDTVECEA